MALPITDESRFYSRRDTSRFSSPVILDGWSRRSVWGFRDGVYYLTLWRDDAPVDADPDLWHSFGHQPPLRNPGAVAITLMGYTKTDPVTASAALQILAPPPTADPRPQIVALAHREMDATYARNPGNPSAFDIGEFTAYRWLAGRLSETPASYVPCAVEVPDWRQIVAEWNVVTGVLSYPIDADSRPYFAGVDSAFAKVMGTFR